MSPNKWHLLKCDTLVLRVFKKFPKKFPLSPRMVFKVLAQISEFFFPAKWQLVNILRFSGFTDISLVATKPLYLKGSRTLGNMQMNECDCVLTKLYLLKKAKTKQRGNDLAHKP